MSLAPYFQASSIIQFHVFFAAIALFLGPFVLWRRRRDPVHKIAGYIWVVAMGTAAGSALFIPSHFSPIGLGPIHVLSLFTFWGLYVAMAAIFRRDIKTHEETMKNLYARGVCLAGAFNFLPGRTTQRALIPEYEWVGYIVISLVVVWAFVPLIRQARQPRNRAGQNTLAVQTQGR